MGELMQRGLWKGLVIGLLAPSLLMACGDAAEFENADLESELNDAEVEETEQGLTFAPLSDAGDVVSYVELGRYVGEWFEIATTPSRQQAVCAGTKAIYAAGDDGRIDVTNQCNQGSLDGRLQQVEGYAEVVDGATNAKLEVTFFGFSAPYWVIALDGRSGGEPYAWAVVSGPSDESLWLLSRTAQIDADMRAEIESHLEARGIDTSRWLDTEQPTETQD